MERDGVSVIIVVKNGEKYLRDAIESVLCQTLAPSEILLVDGRSTDGTKTIARSYPEIRILNQVKSGLANARNFGIEHAAHELIAFLDHDDLWAPNKLELQMEVFLQDPEIGYCYGQVQLFLEEGIERRAGFEEHHFRHEQIGRTPGTLIARKSLFDKIGVFDPKYAIACDVDWFTRAADLNAKAAFISEILLYKRIHATNLSSNVRTNKKELFRVIKKSLDRQQQVRQEF
jgi:glycosyltransferase involved in cell wall biosynthesis